MESDNPSHNFWDNRSPAGSPEQGAGSDIERARAAASLGEIGTAARVTLELKLSSEAVRIRQKRIPFHMRWERSDYSGHRRDFLSVLADHQSGGDEPHEALSPRDISERAGREDITAVEVMKAIRRWLDVLSYHRQPLITGTGKRGRGSLYSVNPNFFLDLKDPQARLPEAPVLQPLPTAAEIYEAVKHLSQFDFALNEYGILEISPEVEMQLTAQKPDYRELLGSGSTVSEYRAEALAKAELMFTDPGYLKRYKESLGKDTPEYGFLRYALDLSPNEKLMVRRLLKATLEPVYEEGSRLRLDAVDENGMIIAYASPRKPEDKTEAEPEPPAEPVTATPQPRPQLSAERQRDMILKNELDQSTISMIEGLARETALVFLSRFKADKSYRLSQIQSAFPRLTVPKLVSAKSNNVITSVKQKPLSLEDVMRVMIYSDSYLQNSVTSRRYKDKVESIIQEVIAEVTEEVRRQISGEDEYLEY